MEGRNKGLIVFGIVLLIIGLVSSFYKAPYYNYYPYQTFGIILSMAGIIIVVLGFLYPSHKTSPPLPTP